MHRPRTLVLTAAACFLLADAPLSAQERVSSRLCTTSVLEEEEALPPSADALRRMAVHAELMEAVRAAAHEAGIAEPRGYVVVAQGPRGSATVHLHRSNVPQRVVRQVQRAMVERLAEGAQPDGRIFFNGRIDPIDLPPEGLPRGPEVVECRPSLLNENGIQARLNELLQRQLPGGNPQISASLRMWVTPEGDVAYAEMTRPTGISHLDRALTGPFASSLRFTPARVGGRPVAVWTELPLLIAPRAPRDPNRDRSPSPRGTP